MTDDDSSESNPEVRSPSLADESNDTPPETSQIDDEP